jgi:hypothetical protein
MSSTEKIQDDRLDPLFLVSLDNDRIKQMSAQLFSWMRTFWTTLYKDKDFVKYLQGSRALRAAQLYLDLLEAVQLLDHAKAPVFHRERWHPIIVRKSKRYTGDVTTIKLGPRGSAVLADNETGQPEGVYREGQKLIVGPGNKFDGLVTYGLDDDIVSVVSCIVDSVADPKVVLSNGSDFKIVGRSIVIRDELDPFSEGSGFATFEVPESPDCAADEEAVMWACDTLIDKDFVFKYSGYAVGLRTESSEACSRIVRAVWDATTDGLSLQHLKDVIAAMLCVPQVLDDKERIDGIYEADGRTKIITDKNVYMLGPSVGNDDLRSAVKTGNTLYKGDLFDRSVRIYPFVRRLDDVNVLTEYDAETFKKDVTSLEIPAALVRDGNGPGFYVGWDEVDIMCDGFDKNGNPKLSFDLGLDDYDDVRYWSSVWDYFEKSGKSMASCFKSIDSDNIVEGSACGKVSPLEFFLEYVVGANTLIVVVDTDKVADDSPLFDPNFFNALKKLVPDHVRLYFIEHGSVVNDDYFGDIDGATEDEAESSVFAGEYDDDMYDSDDTVDSRWTRRCKHRDDSDDYD